MTDRMNAPTTTSTVNPEKRGSLEAVTSHHGAVEDTVKGFNIPDDRDLDAFGSQKKKTDPAEIKLVRKLDLWLMVRNPEVYKSVQVVAVHYLTRVS